MRFGDYPFTVEGVRSVHEGPTAVSFEMDVRWSGDTKVILGIETYALG